VSYLALPASGAGAGAGVGAGAAAAAGTTTTVGALYAGALLPSTVTLRAPFGR
jgi:hypothetical protein